MNEIPFLWNFLNDVKINNENSEARERVTESANEESNIHSIEFH